MMSGWGLTWSGIPQNLLDLIIEFSNLSFTELCAIPCVCKSWNQCCSSSQEFWKAKYLAYFQKRDLCNHIGPQLDPNINISDLDKERDDDDDDDWNPKKWPTDETISNRSTNWRWVLYECRPINEFSELRSHSSKKSGWGYCKSIEDSYVLPTEVYNENNTNWKDKFTESLNYIRLWKDQSKRSDTLRFIIFGPSKSGKTTILRYLESKKKVPQVETSGSANVVYLENWNNTGKNILIYESEQPRKWITEKFEGAKRIDGLIYVVDAERMQKAAYLNTAYYVLHQTLGDAENEDALLLVYANKSDCSNAMSVKDIQEYLRLGSLFSCSWYQSCTPAITATCGITGRNVHAGLSWLVKHSIKNQPNDEDEDEAENDEQNNESP